MQLLIILYAYFGIGLLLFFIALNYIDNNFTKEEVEEISEYLVLLMCILWFPLLIIIILECLFCKEKD